MISHPTVLVILFLYSFTVVNSYSIGNLGMEHIAGIWRLKSTVDKKGVYPLKEFTVYPTQPGTKKSVSVPSISKNNDVFLLLREDGNFVQYYYQSEHRNGNKSSSSSLLVKARKFLQSDDDNDDNKEEDGMKGIWSLVDGKLILAADRPPSNHRNKKKEVQHDTILIGTVVANSGERLMDNPALLRKKEEEGVSQKQQNATNTTNLHINEESSSPQVEAKKDKTLQQQKEQDEEEDVHLSVPKGKVQTGKFFYPKSHPSFFEQPIYQPKPTGKTFELKQVLGSLNTSNQKTDTAKETFRKQDLMNKRFFVTSYPLQKRKKKQRWSIKYNKYVDDILPTQQQKQNQEADKLKPTLIKSFEVELFANNTFTTIKGLGDMILRGKWWIIGNERDQLWMQVWRFGFGRSVSGSTFSEGSSLSQKDEVAYWGKIYKVGESSSSDETTEDDTFSKQRESALPTEQKPPRVEINGSVMDGCGLEPCSVGRFTMIEKTEEDVIDDEEDDDDGFDDDYDDNLFELNDDIGAFE